MCEEVAGKDKAKDISLTALNLSAAVKMLENAPSDGAVRFVPALKEVKAALQLYEEAGIELETLPGVPVFQAEGLFVEGGNKQVRSRCMCSVRVNITCHRVVVNLTPPDLHASWSQHVAGVSRTQAANTLSPVRSPHSA